MHSSVFIENVFIDSHGCLFHTNFAIFEINSRSQILNRSLFLGSNEADESIVVTKVKKKPTAILDSDSDDGEDNDKVPEKRKPSRIVYSDSESEPEEIGKKGSKNNSSSGNDEFKVGKLVNLNHCLHKSNQSC